MKNNRCFDLLGDNQTGIYVLKKLNLLKKGLNDDRFYLDSYTKWWIMDWDILTKLYKIMHFLKMCARCRLVDLELWAGCLLSISRNPCSCFYCWSSLSRNNSNIHLFYHQNCFLKLSLVSSSSSKTNFKNYLKNLVAV